VSLLRFRAPLHYNRINISEFSSGENKISQPLEIVSNIFMKTPLPSEKNKINLLDASYDYKNRTVNNTNIVPIYHALNSSTTGEVSFASDDFTD
jgi:hypothetical protein